MRAGKHRGKVRHASFTLHRLSALDPHKDWRGLTTTDHSPQTRSLLPARAKLLQAPDGPAYCIERLRADGKAAQHFPDLQPQSQCHRAEHHSTAQHAAREFSVHALARRDCS